MTGARVALAVALGLAPVLACAGELVVYPGSEWAEREPEELGLDDDRLDELARRLRGSGMVVVDGYVVKRWGPVDRANDWYSAAKPVLSTLLLRAAERGLVAGLDARVAEFGWRLRDADRTMTLRQLTNMTSGYARPEPPGAAFAYNDYGVALFQRTLFDRVFEADPDRVLREELGALGFQDGPAFSEERRRLEASVRDFARVAWLWARGGRWDGRTLLPGDAFRALFQPQVPAHLPHTGPGSTDDYLGVDSFGGGSDHFTRDGPGIYGGFFWFNAPGRDHPQARTWPSAPADTVLALGAHGNAAALFPGRRAVVVAARARWGRLEAGRRGSDQDEVLALAARAVARSGLEAERAAAAGAEAAGADRPVEDVTLDGERRVWHRLTLGFAGPRSDEDARENPFRDYRLDVTFAHQGREIVVPGHFAADGRAADTGATGGDRWRVHFAPDAPGEWSWRASFRRGEDAAVADDPDEGRAVFFHGASGRFRVEPSDKTGRDHRARGALRYVGERYLRFAGSGEPFLKGGANSPENFLAYHEFDATPPSHRYAPHARDFREGALWRGGRGRNIVGALEYLAGQGMNAVYFLTMNVRGDGKDVWPWTDPEERDRFDVSKLDQWEIVFSHMTRLGLLMHVVTQETENDRLLDGGELGARRRLYYRELVSRFAHHPALVWNLGEENRNSDAQRRAFAQHLTELDPYDHPVSVHTYPDQTERVYRPLLGFPFVTAASLQVRQSHAEVLRWVRASEAAGHPWVVSLDEVGPSSVGVMPDAEDPEHEAVRRRHLWPTLLAGGAGVEWYFGYRYAHHDLTCEDWRSRERMWEQTRVALEFFREHLPFPEMTSCDERLSGAAGHCFAAPGRVYAVYLPDGAATDADVRLDLGDARGPFRVRWLDPRRGGPLLPGPTLEGPGPASLGPPPTPAPTDWTALIDRRS